MLILNLYVLVKLNGGRLVVGILRGFDPFMNMVIDESIEECKDGTKNNIGMVVSSLNKNY
jgi:small nuclear ribonucleoprotein G